MWEHNYWRMFEHTCDLDKDEDDVKRAFPDDTRGTKIKRFLIRIRLISEKHPNTQKYFKSIACIRNEKRLQLLFFPYIIHPFSEFRQYWDYTMMIIAASLLLSIPVDVLLYHLLLHERDLNYPWLYYRSTIDLFCIFDILFNLSTGYWHPLKRKVIFQPMEVKM